MVISILEAFSVQKTPLSLPYNSMGGGIYFYFRRGKRLQCDLKVSATQKNVVCTYPNTTDDK